MAKKRPRKQSFRMDLPFDLTTRLVERIEGLQPSIKTDYLKSQYLSKFVSEDGAFPSTVRRRDAIFKWLCTELVNESTNERLLLTPEEYQILPRVTFKSFVEWCQATIVDIIGEFPPESALIGSFSGGASTSRSRLVSQPAFKFVGKAHVTRRCLPLFIDCVENMGGWLNAMDLAQFRTEEVPGNVLFTVPKNTEIDRVACKEPDLNMFIQKGLGDFISHSLRRVGINLNDQSRNRSLAHEGSVTGKLATLDLSSASDSMTEGLVALLLPVYWHTVLDAARCHVTIIDGEEHRNQMFSSMGNGFTFELESLLFYVITRAVCYFTSTPGTVSVYGDDIICPAEITELLTFVLGWFGFQVNTKKSYSTGPFRESCGGHYHHGVDITPFYIKGPIKRMDDLIHVANSLRGWAKHYESCILDPEVENIWLWLKSYIPRCLWGGVDISFKYQLVSKDTPSHRLSEETDKKDTGLGGYYHWLNATRNRVNFTETISTSSFSRETGIFRLKKARPSTVRRVEDIFYHEIYPMPDQIPN